MMVISVIGGSGFIGTTLLKYLSQKYSSAKIRVLVHKHKPGSNFSNVTFVEGDIVSGRGLDDLLAQNTVVFNLAFLANASYAENIQATTNIVEACIRHKVKRLIHCSTAVVVGRNKADLVNEETVCHPGSPYELTKLDVENSILKAASEKIEVAVLRPTAVFGPGGKNLLKLSNQIVFGNGFINYVRSCLFYKRAMNLVCVENVVEALTFLAFYPGSLFNEIFIISDDEFVDNNYLYVEEFLMRKFLGHGRRFPIIPVPQFVLRSLLSLLGKPQPNPLLRYECQKIKKLGFNKTASLQAGLESYSQWYISQK